MKKKSFVTFQNLKEKNQSTLNACFNYPLAACIFWLPKLLVTIFGMG